MRDDIEVAIASSPTGDQANLRAAGQQALVFLDEHIPAGEHVLAVRAVAVGISRDLPRNSCLALTSRRLLFVAPRPQVLSWPLAAIIRVTPFGEQIHIEDSAGTTLLGINQQSAKDFDDILAAARAAATLVYG